MQRFAVRAKTVRRCVSYLIRGGGRNNSYSSGVKHDLVSELVLTQLAVPVARWSTQTLAGMLPSLKDLSHSATTTTGSCSGGQREVEETL
jgi:hypothetical protein